MRLSQIKNNRFRFNQQVSKARAEIVTSAQVNCGIKDSTDISAILNNGPAEPLDWSGLYAHAEQFD